MKKFFLCIVLVLFTSCGFKPVNNLKNYNYQIVEIEISGNKLIKRYLKQNLERFKNNDNANKFFKTYLSCEKKRIITSKNSAGEPSSYKLEIVVDLKVTENNKSIINEQFIKSSNYNELNSKFELRQFENILIKDLTKMINFEINALLTSVK